MRGKSSFSAELLGGRIAARMELGSLLVLAKLITVEQLNDALERQIGNSGRLGDHLIAAGYMTEQALAKFLDTFPVEPSNIEAVGIDETDLLGLLMTQIYTG